MTCYHDAKMRYDMANVRKAPTLLVELVHLILVAPMVMAQMDPQLVGTWTTKSGAVLTGSVRDPKLAGSNAYPWLLQ